MTGLDFRYVHDARCPHVGRRVCFPIRTLGIFVTVKQRLQPGLDSAEQAEPHLVVIACERDHEAHPAMA
jgi:hypothetical protein